MPLLSYALTTLSGLKLQLNIADSDTSQDDWLTELINASTEKIERETGRRFAATDYVDWINGTGEPSIPLDQYPIIRVNALATSAQDSIEISYTGSSIHTTVTVTGSLVRLSTMIADGTTTTTEIDWATYPTASTVATAIAAVSGWLAILKNDGPAKHIRPMSIGLDSGVATCLRSADGYTSPSVVDYDSGVLTLDGGASGVSPYGGGGVRVGSAAGYGLHNLMADFRAGYATIPADIDQLCREFAAGMYTAGGMSSGLTSESLGSYSYSIADQTSFNESQSAVLSKYSRAVVA